MIKYTPKDCTPGTEKVKGEYKFTQEANKARNITTVEKVLCDPVETEQNKTIVKNAPQSGCVTVSDLYNKAKIHSDKVLFSSISFDQFVEFTNLALNDFYALNTNGWNFSLSDKYTIELEQGKCQYDLPTDFFELLYVGNCSKSDCCPMDQVFEIVDPNQFDSISGKRYAASYIYDPYKDRAKLLVKMPCMSNCNDGNCECSCSICDTKLCIKYYRSVPQAQDFSSELCQLPKRWGAVDILVQLIAQRIYAYKGKAYQLDASFQNNLQKLMRIDSGKTPSNPIKRGNSLNFSIQRCR